MDLMSLVTQLIEDGTVALLVGNRLAQFGDADRPLLGATILPERIVDQNTFTEARISYRTVIANDGTRYSPVQKKSSGELIGEFLVSLGHQDIGVEMTAQDYDALIMLLERNDSMEGMARVIDWLDISVVRALVHVMEKQRWEAILDAEVIRAGDNGYLQTVTYPNPAGHRAAASGVWTNDANDPWDDLMAMKELLDDKGYGVSRIIMSSPTLTDMLRNSNIKERAGSVRVLSASDIIPGTVSVAQVNGALQADDLPPIETYNARYRTQAAGSIRFLPHGNVVMIGDSGQDVEILDDLENARFLPNTVGYSAIGRAAGQPRGGRVVRLEGFDNKPPRLEAEGWQTSLPVITEPEAFAVITDTRA